MDRFSIVGPTRLEGTVYASGAKNAALPELAACLLTDEPMRLTRVPRVRDIRTMCRLLEHLGLETGLGDDDGNGGGGSVELRRNGPVGDAREAPYELVKTMRASVLVLGPLLARYGEARVSLPGGCAIGVRPIDQHLAGLRALGAEVELEHGYVAVRAPRLTGARFRFDMPTVGGTENLLMAASLARGTTRLENCAAEPEVEDLAVLLRAMGARIEIHDPETSSPAGTVIEIEGVETLGGTEHRVIPDRIEAGTYLIAGTVTGGAVRVEGARSADLAPLTEKLARAGVAVDEETEAVAVRGNGEIAPVDVDTAPHPGFPTDLQAQYMALMTRADGTATIRETVFENRFQHVPELHRMGAEIEIEGRIARVRGPAALTGAHVMATDLRASASLVLAGLAAHGETVVHRIYHLDRGYEAMESKLQALGARVCRVTGAPAPD